MKITLFTGAAQYGALPHFAERLAGGLREHGVEADHWHVGSMKVNEFKQTIDARFAAGMDAFLSFNAGPNEAFKWVEPPPNPHGAQVLSWMVDPAFHLHHRAAFDWGADTPSSLGWIDNDHLPLARRVAPPQTRHHFWPHMALDAEPLAEATFDGAVDIVVFASQVKPRTFLDNLDGMGGAFSRRGRELIEECLGRSDANPGDVWLEMSEDLECPIEISWLNMVYNVDNYLRNRKRERVLKALRKQGVVCDLFGNGHEGSAAARGHRVHGSVPLAEVPHILARATMLLDIGPGFTNGSHERPLAAMTAGTLALTESSNHFWQRTFGDSPLHASYDAHAVEDLADRIAVARERAAATSAADAAAAAQDVRRSFGPEAAAQRVLDAIHAARAD